MLVFKSEMTKAFDRIYWNFLKRVLIKFGFCMKWMVYIMELSLVLNTLCVNGRPVGNFPSKRGFKQRNPLSPLLFTTCEQLLSQNFL